jgi:endonuclease/exonuclease/phosphatase family metal-dependent hydrolase
MTQDSDCEREPLKEKTRFSNGARESVNSQEVSTSSGFASFAGPTIESVRRRTSSIDNHHSEATLAAFQAQYAAKVTPSSSSSYWKQRYNNLSSEREAPGSIAINLRSRGGSFVRQSPIRSAELSVVGFLRLFVAALLTIRGVFAFFIISFCAIMWRLYSMPQVRRGTFLTFRGEKILPFLGTFPLIVLFIVAWSNGWWKSISSRDPSSFNVDHSSPTTNLRRRRVPVILQILPILTAILLALLYIFLKEHSRYADFKEAASQYYRYLHEDVTEGSRSLSLGGIPIRAMTYNVFIRPPGITGAGGDDHKDERLRLLAPRLANYDVICFQELFDSFSTRRSALIEAVSLFGLRFSAYLPRNFFMFPPKIIDGGVSILSRYPIVETDYIHFRNIVTTTIDSIVGKGVLYARIELPSSLSSDIHSSWNSSSFPQGVVYSEHPVAIEKARFLHVFSTHMQAGDRLGYKPEKYHAGIRLKQIEEMRDFVLRKTKDDQGPILITGDFNINARVSRDNSSDSKWYRELMKRLQAPSSAEEQLEPLNLYDLLYLHFKEHPITDDSKCIDYFLFDPRKGRVVASYVDDDAAHIEPFRIAPEEQDPDHPMGAPTLSDHSAVISTLRVLLHSPEVRGQS